MTLTGGEVGARALKDYGMEYVTEQVTKRTWTANSVNVLPTIMQQVVDEVLPGRPEPAHVTVPMDVQVEAGDVTIHPLEKHWPFGAAYPDSCAIAAAITALVSTERPVIVASGGRQPLIPANEVRLA